MISFTALAETQLKQYTNTEQLYRAFRAAAVRATQYRGGMIWRTQKGREYLVKTSPTGSQRGIGVRSPETDTIYKQFVEGKKAAETALAMLKAKVAETERVNRALRVGHCPNIVVDILEALRRERLTNHFMVIGTNALYAYEAHAGVRFVDDITATEDLDVLWDSRKAVSLVITEDLQKEGLLGVLRKADPSFMMMDDQRYSAMNASGYMVDLIKRRPQSLHDDREQQQIHPNENDFWAAKVHNMDWLLSSPKFVQTIVSTNGKFAEMVVPDPRAFVLFKAWLAQQPNRNPTKKPRDAMQAKAVFDLINEYLPHLSFADIHVFPEALRHPFPDIDAQADVEPNA